MYNEADCFNFTNIFPLLFFVKPYDAAARYIDTEFFPTKIYIGDLEGVSYDDLERTFGRYGPVRQVKIVENKEYEVYFNLHFTNHIYIYIYISIH